MAPEDSVVLDLEFFPEGISESNTILLPGEEHHVVSSVHDSRSTCRLSFVVVRGSLSMIHRRRRRLRYRCRLRLLKYLLSCHAGTVTTDDDGDSDDDDDDEDDDDNRL